MCNLPICKDTASTFQVLQRFDVMAEAQMTSSQFYISHDKQNLFWWHKRQKGLGFKLQGS